MYFFLAYSFICTFVLIIVLTKYSKFLNLIDKPNFRKIHIGEIPLVGGIAIILNVIIGIFIFPSIVSNNFYIIIFLCAFLGLLGAIDDIIDLNFSIKLIIQSIIILLIIFCGVKINHLGSIPQIGFVYVDDLFIPLSIIFTFIAILGFINAINFIDGVDGLSSIYLIFSVIIYIFFSSINNNIVNFNFFFFLIISILSFILFNLSFFNLKKVFLGDAGTFFLSSLIGSLFIIYSQVPYNFIHPLLVPWCINIVIYDLLFNTLRRSLLKTNPFKPDNLHLHHRLLNKNISPNKVVILIISLQFVLSFIGFFVFYKISIMLSFLLFIILFFIYAALLRFMNLKN